MLAALVYCEVGGTNSGGEREMIVECLTKEIGSITPVQMGLPSRPDTVFSNEGGHGILNRLSRMEDNMTQLQNEVTTLRPLEKKVTSLQNEVTTLRPLRKEVASLRSFRKEVESLRHLRKEVESLRPLRAEVASLRPFREEVVALRPLREEVKILCEELTTLRPLRLSAGGIRSRFFATTRLRAGMGGIGVEASIRVGNDIAHGGDVRTDICLLKHGQIQFHQTFKYLYGITWVEADDLIGKLINVSKFPKMQ